MELEKKAYVLEKLEEWVMHDHVQWSQRTSDELLELKDAIVWETRNVLKALKAEIFRIPKNRKAVEKFGKNYRSLVLLLNQNYENLHAQKFNPEVRSVYELMEQQLQAMLKSLEGDFAHFLNPSLPVDIPRLLEFREQLIAKMEPLLKKLFTEGWEWEPATIVKECFQRFIRRVDLREEVDRQEMEWVQGVFQDLEAIESATHQHNGCAKAHELLVYWNVNTWHCIEYFIKGKDILLAQKESYQDKLDFLQYEIKIISQMPIRPNFIYNPDLPSLRNYFIDFLERDVQYMKVHHDRFTSSSKLEEKPAALPNDLSPKQGMLPKIMVALSADQIGLMLRALDERRIIIGKSLSAVLRSIIPFLSTPQQTELNWDNIRKRTYSIENSDKEKVIAVLEDVIASIKKY